MVSNCVPTGTLDTMIVVDCRFLEGFGHKALHPALPAPTMQPFKQDQV